MNIFVRLRLGSERYPALTGVRAIAAFLVFFHHLRLSLKPDWLVGLESTFYWGVTLFFILSGFLITHRYYEKIVFSGRWLLTYFINRFARIYPVYFLALTVVILLNRDYEPIFLLQNYTLTHSLFFLFKSHGMAIAPSWSLTVEECFYLLAPFIFLLCKKYNFWVPFLINLLLLVLLLLTYGNDMSLHHTFFPILFGTFFGHFLEFYVGIYLALFVLKREKKAAQEHKNEFGAEEKAGGENRVAGQKWTIVGIAAITLLMIPLIYVTNKNTTLREIVMIVVNNFMLPFPIAMAYYGLISEKSFCRRLLSGKLMGLLGRSSYAFYLLHLPVIDYLGTPFIRRYFDSSHYNLYVATMFLLTIVLSVIVFVLYEDPLNHFIRRKFTIPL